MNGTAFRALIPALVVAAAGGPASCISATDPVEILTWDGTLVASDGIVDGLSGTVAMVIGEGQTQIGVAVHLAPAGETLGWALHEGVCVAPGSRVGPANVFPGISVDNDGDGQAETVLFRRIATAGPYAVVIHENEDGTGIVLACGDLEQK